MSKTTKQQDVCDDCGKPQRQVRPGPVLRPDVWAKLARTDEWLCSECTAKRVGAQGMFLTLADLVPCEFNFQFGWFEFFAPEPETLKAWDEELNRPGSEERTRDDIEKRGRSIICVMGGKSGPPFAYTIGNSLAGLPELLLIGTSDGSSLNALSRIMIKRNAAFADDELVDLGGKVPVKIIAVTDLARARDDYTIQAGVYFGHENYPVQQVLIPDSRGRFPGEPKCAEPYASMPILRNP